MKLRKLFFIILFLIATPPLGAIVRNVDADNDSELLDNYTLSKVEESATSLRGLSRFLDEKSLPLPANYTCNKYPKVCRLKGSAGRDCCKKKCVNVKTDRLNCGSCGNKCRYNESCCKGKCKNTHFDEKNCGECHKKCKKGEFCAYGMCSYA